jgi:hypothetical protein
LAYSFQWEYSHKRLKLAQLLGQLGCLSHLSGARRFSGLTYSKTDAAVAVAGVAQESSHGR